MKQTDHLVQQIELPESIIGLRKDGIIHIYYRPHTEITCEYQLRQLEILRGFAGDQKRPVIYEAGENVTVGKEAREHAAELEKITPTLCKVVYVETLAHRLIGEFYYKFNKPEQPYKVFSNFQDGIEWLLKTAEQLQSKRQ